MNDYDPMEALRAEGIPIPQPIPDEEIASRQATLATIPTGANTGNPKDAVGDTKPDLSLIPQAFNLMVAHAMMDGAKKYGPYNWRDNPVKARVYVAAAMRHLAQFLDGENFDPISEAAHIGHAGACLAILADAYTVGNLIDDRPKPGKAGDLIRKFGDAGNFQS